MAKGSLDNYQQDPLFKQAVHSGLISNPALLEQIALQQKAAPNDPRERLHLEVTEMWCPACAEVIRLILLQEKGISSCQVDYSTDLASIEFSPRYLSKEKILASHQWVGLPGPASGRSGKESREQRAHPKVYCGSLLLLQYDDVCLSDLCQRL